MASDSDMTVSAYMDPLAAPKRLRRETANWNRSANSAMVLALFSLLPPPAIR